MNKKYLIYFLILLVIIGVAVVFTIPFFKKTTPPTESVKAKPIITGIVSSIDKKSLSVTVLKKGTATSSPSSIVYIVDASKAKILQGSKIMSLSDIVLNSNVLVQGIINNNTVSANLIIIQNKIIDTN